MPYICIKIQLLIVPHSFAQFSHHTCTFSIVLVDFSVEHQVASDGGVQIKSVVMTSSDFMVLYSHMQYHNVTINKQTQEDFFNKICTSQFICNVWKGYSSFARERELETEHKLQYFDPHSYGRQRCVFLVLLMLNRRPRGPLCWVMAFFTASYQHLLWIPIQSVAPSPFGLVWLSLLHLV